MALQCNLQINKDRKVRMSQWHVMPLTEEQQIYAAIDVYVSVHVHFIGLNFRAVRSEIAIWQPYALHCYLLTRRTSHSN